MYPDISNNQLQGKRLLRRLLAEPAERVFVQREMTPVPTWAERSHSKADSIPQTQHKQPDYSLKMDSEKITFVSGNIFDGQTKMQLKLLVLVKILGINGEAYIPENTVTNVKHFPK